MIKTFIIHGSKVLKVLFQPQASIDQIQTKLHFILYDDDKEFI